MGSPTVRANLHLIPLSVVMAAACLGQTASAPAPEPALVQRALAAELEAAQDTAHPMRFRMRKSSPRLTTTKDIVETRDGSVARLIAVNDKPPDQDAEQKDEARLNGLLADPGKQRHRKQSEAQDTARAIEVIRVLPRAFLYQPAGTVASSNGQLQRFTFTPNPAFNPPDLETQVLTAMKGELWIDPVHTRVTHLEGHLQQDIDFGWGILGRLYKGGWITLDQSDVGGGQWRVVHFKMEMSARLVWRTRNFNTIEEQSEFVPVPRGLSYQEGITMLRSTTSAPGSGR